MSIDEDRLMDLENQLDEAQKEIERRDGQIEDLVVTCERLEAELKAMTVSRDEYKSAFSDFLHYASNARDEYKSCERREP